MINNNFRPYFHSRLWKSMLREKKWAGRVPVAINLGEPIAETLRQITDPPQSCLPIGEARPHAAPSVRSCQDCAVPARTQCDSASYAVKVEGEKIAESEVVA